MSGRVEALCLSEQKGTTKRPAPIAKLRAGHGLEGDAHAGDWHRQVSLLAAESIAEFAARGRLNLPPGAFAENLVLSGLPLDSLGLGSQLQVGAKALLEVTQIGKTCHQRCAIFFQTGDCILPRLGLFCRVLQGGAVSVGDQVTVSRVVPRSLSQAAHP